jgi:WD40 repeat protein/tRNA A-37 threonylcarbamoyl transferase component Bud32
MPPGDHAHDEQEFERAVAAHLDALEAGQAQSPESLLAAFPDRRREIAQIIAEFAAESETGPPLGGAASPLPPPPSDSLSPGGLVAPAATVFRPELLGDYELLDEVARGGMGVVFKARQRSLNRIVALKMIRGSWLPDEEQARRFRCEAEAAARLQHPDIVAVHDVGQHHGRLYFTMDFVDGRSLADLIRSEPPAARAAAQYVAVVADAIHYAHGQGVLHRDLKPSNILVDTSNRPRVTDFGLARRLDVDSDLTATGQVLGTPSYMSPEQARGDQARIGAASDVYALGAVLYELLCGRPPFRAETAVETLRQVADAEPLPARSLNPAIGRDLETICLKCLQKEPGRRYATAAALADDLRRWLEGRPIVARPVGAVTRAWRWCRRRPALAAAIAAAGAAAAVAVAASIGYGLSQSQLATKERLHSLSLEQEQGETRKALLDAKVQRGVAERRGLELSRQLARSQFHTAQRLGEDGDVHRGLLHLASALSLVPQGDDDLDRAIRAAIGAWHERCMPLQNFTHTGDLVLALSPGGTYVLRAGGRGTFLWDAEHDQMVGGYLQNWGSRKALVTADGAWVIESDNSGKVRVWNPTKGELSGSPLNLKPVRAIALSPAADLILISTDDGVQRFDAATLKPIGDPIAGTCTALAFRPDGRAFAACGNSITLYAPDTGAAFGPPFRGYSDPIFQAAFSPDGKWLATSSLQDRVTLWEVEKAASGQVDSQTAPLLMHTSSVSNLEYSPDGRYLITIMADGTAQLWDIERRVAAGPLVHRAFGHGPLAFRSDGNTVRMSDGQGWQLRRLPRSADQRPTTRLYGFRAAFSGDGARLLRTSEKQAQWFDAATAQPLGTPLAHDSQIMAVDVTADGRLAATGDYQGVVKVWNAEGGLVDTTRYDHPISAVRFSPDGKTLAVSCWNQILLWDAQRRAGQALPLPSGKLTRDLTFAPHGALLVAGAGQTLQFWDQRAAILLAEVPAHRTAIGSVAFSPDGSRIATGSDDGAVRLWDAAQRSAIGRALAHRGPVRLVRFSPDGEFLLTAGSREVRIWNHRTGEPIGPALPHDDEVLAMFADSSAGRLHVFASGFYGSPLPRAVQGDPARVKLWLETATGLELDEHGDAAILDAQAWNERVKRLAAMGGPPP